MIRTYISKTTIWTVEQLTLAIEWEQFDSELGITQNNHNAYSNFKSKLANNIFFIYFKQDSSYVYKHIDVYAVYVITNRNSHCSYSKSLDSTSIFNLNSQKGCCEH